MTHTPIGMPDDVAYRLKALNKKSLRWAGLDLFIAGTSLFFLYITLVRPAAK